MERVAADVEAIQLRIADLDALLVDRRVGDSVDFEPGNIYGFPSISSAR
jgi:hypothetical protein